MSEKKSKPTDQADNQPTELEGPNDVVKGMGVPKMPFLETSRLDEGAVPPKQPVSPKPKAEKPQDKEEKKD